MKHIASTETLDRIATNALGLRLGDQALAHDIYTDIRTQVIRATERWHDVNIAIELVQLSVNGKARPIRRTERKGAQLYTTSLGPTAMNGEPVTVAYTYRVLVQRHGHLLYLDLPRPTKGLKVQFNYANAGIRRVNTLDFIASAQSARVEDTPGSVPGRSVGIGFDGWIFPRSGVVFVWVLEGEMGEGSNLSRIRVAGSGKGADPSDYD